MLRTKLFLWAGLILVSTGVIGNEWTLARLFSEDGNLAVYSRFLIWVLDVYLILAGSLLIVQKERPWIRWAGTGGLALVFIPLIVQYIFRMGYLFQIDFNEGWNVYQTLKVASGLPLYTNRLSMTPVNYPPVSFYLVGRVGQFLHDPLMAGRLTSLISLLLISVGCGVAVHILGKNPRAAVFSSVFCLGVFVTYGRGYVGMDDPQMLGQAILLTGLIVYLHDKSGWLTVALLCCLGLFTKHNLFAIPLAISADILLRSRLLFIRWVLAFLAVGCSLLALTIAVHGTDFLYHLAAPRGFEAEQIMAWLGDLGPGLVVGLFLAGPWLAQAVKDESKRIIPLYLAISMIWGLLASGGIGIDINIFFDFFIGLALAAGMSLSDLCIRLRQWDPKSIWAPNLLPLLFSLGILAQLPSPFPERAAFAQYSSREQSFVEDAAYLAARPGPVICSNILLCHAAGHSFVFDPFLVTEGMFFGRYQEKEVLAQLEAGYYSVVQLNYPLDDRYCEATIYGSVQRSNAIFTENFLQALGSHYALARQTLTGAFYEPRQSPCQLDTFIDN